jgi:general stress protein 26
MSVEDAVVLDILRRSMVARIATLSRSGRPSVNPLYFIYFNSKIWLGTPEWTLAARNVKADPRVSMLFNVEQDPGDRRVLRVSGQARVRTDSEALRSYNPRVARKYILTRGGITNWLTHPRQLWLRRYYTAQSAQKGLAGVIEVTPEKIELLTGS